MPTLSAALRFLAISSCLVLLGGCASSPESEPHPRDPLESFNRGVHSFNTALDEAIVRPVAVGYDKTTPKPVKWIVANFFANLTYPVTVVNLGLQGKFGDAGKATGRFLANTTVGLGGMFDVASEMGIPRHDEDFGQTLAVWGWQDSSYLVLPFLGASTVRDGISRFPDGAYLDPLRIYSDNTDRYSARVFNLIQTRQQFLERDKDVREAADPYSMLRDVYLQRRDFLIKDGETETIDYESFLED
jgi:phospholipid-binding lipoprotein MlaA